MTTTEFLNAPGVIVDLRSPCEYEQGHIPEAISLPLFTNQERAEVGTCYKKLGKERAFDLAVKLVSPKLPSLIAAARKLKIIKCYCWRGGMRSQFAHQLFSMAGLDSTLLPGGYKFFRNWTLDILEKPLQYHVVGGLTGVGKTELLHLLKSKGEHVLDLEGLAKHRGSTFGQTDQQQPTNEHFENTIAMCLSLFSTDRPVWIEDESRMIGKNTIPNALFSQMRLSPIFMLECPKEERIARLTKEYGNLNKDFLIEATKKLHKRLGSERMNQTIQAIENRDPKKALELLLHYYDKAYTASKN